MCIIDVTGALLSEIPVSHTYQLMLLYADYNRDDLTVEVIFFGNGDKSGDVMVNKDASALAHDIKAKL